MDIEAITERIRKLEAQKQSLKARMKTKQRKQDTRRKILLGALLLEHLHEKQGNDDDISTWVKQELPIFLTRENDKLLFQDMFETTNNDTTTKDGDHNQPVTINKQENE